MKGYYSNSMINIDQVFSCGGNCVWIVGLKAFDSEGKCVPCPIAVIDSLGVTKTAKDGNNQMPIYLNSHAQYYLIEADTLEIKGKLATESNNRPLTDTWIAIYEGHEQGEYLQNNFTGENREFRERIMVRKVLAKNLFLVTLNHNTSNKAVGLYDVTQDKWQYVIDIDGPIEVVNEDYFLELKPNETLVRSMNCGTVHGQMSPMTYVREKSYREGQFTVIDRSVVLRYDVGSRQETKLNYKLDKTAQYFSRLQKDVVVVYCITDNTVQVYELDTMTQSLNMEVPFENLASARNKAVFFQKYGDLLTFTRSEESEFEEFYVRIPVRYFFDPKLELENKVEIEELQAKCEPVGTDNKLHDYRLWFNSNTPFDVFYRQSVAYIEAICVAYGFSLMFESPYDEYWSGKLILDTSDQDFSENEYSDIENLLKFLELNIMGLAKPPSRKVSKINLVLSRGMG